MEAAGIEPASENDQLKASTSVGPELNFTQWIAPGQTAIGLALL